MPIRTATRSDLDAVQAIYAVEVLESTASFETTPPEIAEIERRYLAVRDAGLPYVVVDLGGEIGGYACAHPYHSRPGYRLTVETSIYVARHHQGRGIGSALLDEVVKACLIAGKRQMVAIIGDSDNRPSIRVHEKTGFRVVGTLRDVGFKFGRFLDVVIMQRAIGNESTTG